MLYSRCKRSGDSRPGMEQLEDGSAAFAQLMEKHPSRPKASAPLVGVQWERRVVVAGEVGGLWEK